MWLTWLLGQGVSFRSSVVCCVSVKVGFLSLSGNARQREQGEQEGVGGQGPTVLEEAQPRR